MQNNHESITLHYAKTGQGCPLILLHGNGETHEIFQKAINKLNKNFTVYAIDSRGHGKSTKVDTLNYEEMAEDIYLFIKENQIEKPILYGFSDGGIIALLLSIKYPDILSRAIVSGVNANPNGIKTSWHILFKIYYFFTKSSMFELMLKQPDITKEMLQKITIPVDIIGGSRDMIKKSHMKSIANHINKGTYTLLKGENHSSYVVNSEKIAHIITSKCFEK